MGDYVFKVKLLLADLGYPAFYYRQSICEDKLNCCFQDLRNEVMRRYDLRPSLGVKENYELQWYSDGDMITISNNDDLNIFMRLKGTRLVIVRTQPSGNFYGFNSQFTTHFNPTFAAKPGLNSNKYNGIARFSSSISNRQTIHKPSPIGNSVSLSARELNEKSGEISKTVELPHPSNSSLVDATISSSISGIDVSHVVNDRPKHTAKASVLDGSSAIPDSVSVSASIHVADDQSKMTSPISNVDPQVTLPIPNLQTAVADLHVEYDQLKSTGNMSLPDISSRLDSISVNASNVGDDQPKITTADQETIPQMCSSIPNLRTADEENQPEDTIVVNKIVPQATTPISDLRAVDAVENSPSKHMGNASIVDLISVDVSLGKDDQTEISSSIHKIVPQIISPISDLRTLDSSVNVENDQHTSTTVKSIIGGQSERLASFSRNTTVPASVSSHILSHREVLAKLENMLQFRSQQKQLQSQQNPNNFSKPPLQPLTSEPKLSAQAPEASAHPSELSAQQSELSTQPLVVSKQTPELSAQPPEDLTHAPELRTKTVPKPIPEPKLEECMHYRYKERSKQQPLRPLNFSLPPELPTPLSQLPQPIKHTNPRVQASLNTMTLQMKFSNSGGWLERLLEAVDGDIDEAMRKLQPKMR